MEQRSIRTSALWLIAALVMLAVAGALARQPRTNAATRLAPPPVDFAPPVHYNTDGGASDLVAGDFNKDGFIDLAGVQDRRRTLFIQLNAGDGTFLAPVKYTPQQYGSLPALASGDLNNDGNLDLVVMNGYEPAMNVMLGTGAGGFQLHSTQALGWQPVEVKLADFNKDGKLDVVIANAANNVDVRFGKGDGSFGSPFLYATAGVLFGVTVADLDADGRLDLLLARGNNNLLMIWWGADRVGCRGF